MKIERLGDITRPILAMADDVLRAEEGMNAASDAYSRRNYIRSLFAMIEGTVYVLKQMALMAQRARPELLTTAEIALLNEQSFDLSSKGEARTTTKFLRLVDNLRFTIPSLTKRKGAGTGASDA